MDEYLPLFPLNLVLFPKMLLPLHIFEEKYKDRLRNVWRRIFVRNPVFEDNEIEPIGCSASIHQVLRAIPMAGWILLLSGPNVFEFFISILKAC